MITVTTRNSVYELNIEDSLIRRVSGVNDPTPYQGLDGLWQEATVDAVVIGRSMVIRWAACGGLPTTVTSPVYEVF